MFDFLNSKGIKRTICALLTPLAVIAPHVPALEPYSQLILEVTALFGVTGIVHAGTQKVLKN